MWGPSEPSCHVLSDGKKLLIRSNLHQCLLGLRHNLGGYLWIDQICINESNTTERNHQVQLMSQIYIRCRSMIVWLNDSLGLGAVAARSFSQCRDQDSPATLLHNAYFTRLWIVQEILLAPSTSLLLDGNVWMTWKAIREVVEHTPHDYGDYFKDTRSLIVPAFSRVSFAVHREEEDEYPMNNNSRSLRWLIDGFSSNSCDDPRDRVYSLMGLVEKICAFQLTTIRRPWRLTSMRV
jgi:hypothetical protein